ncbi:hypothetical protein SXCC_01194 [Gluconacetobacter sp. SXCC-1]|nr:hypothetical protein SXCC_01194 [Gluconacetobacter sp. SXCC-1]
MWLLKYFIHINALHLNNFLRSEEYCSDMHDPEAFEHATPYKISLKAVASGCDLPVRVRV